MNSEVKVLTINSKDATSTNPSSRLREIREELGLSRRHVAERLGVTIAAIQDYERSEAAGKITLKTLRKYAKVLGCAVTVRISPPEKQAISPSSPEAPVTRQRPSQSSPAPAATDTTAPSPDLQDRMGLWSAPVND